VQHWKFRHQVVKLGGNTVWTSTIAGVGSNESFMEFRKAESNRPAHRDSHIDKDIPAAAPSW